MTLEEILNQHLVCISTTHKDLEKLSQSSKNNFETIDTRNREIYSFLEKNNEQMKKLTALVQVLQEEVLEIRKKL